MKNFVVSHKIVSIIILIIILLIVWKVFGSDKSQAEIFTVENKTVVQKVTVAGKVKPISEVSLGFEKSGKISRVATPIGTKVFSGQTLVTLDSSSAYADYLKSKANLEVEKVELEKIKRGGTPEEVSLKETEVLNAKNTLENAETNLSDKLEDAYSRSDDAVRNSIDQFFSNAKSSNPQINIYVDNTQLKNDINQGRFQVENLLLEWQKNDFSFSKENINKNIANLNVIKSFVDKVSVAVNALAPNSTLSQTTVDGYKAAVSASRTSLALASTNISLGEEKLNTAKSSLAVAEKNLILEKTGGSIEDVRSQEARIMQFEAEVERNLAELSKFTLKSPINGVITKQEAEVGETVSSNEIIVSIISDSSFEIEANVSEVSIGRVALGNKAVIMMDAFPGKTFKGTVRYIEPGDTLVDGVVNFKIKVLFDEAYPEIKTGLTANLDIETMSKENVLAIPDYAIIRKDGKTFVLKKVGKESIETEISVGLVGSEGLTEIISGVSLGDSVLFAPAAN